MSLSGPTQLLVFGFPSAEGRFEGRIGGALERAESGGALRILRAIFVGRDGATGELAATDLKGSSGGLVAPLLSFRLDPKRRGDVSSEFLAELGALIEPGEAMVAVLVEHSWAAALADAVAWSGGKELADEPIPAADADAFGRKVLAVSSRWKRDPAAPAGRDC
jgi:hypothetical protein